MTTSLNLEANNIPASQPSATKRKHCLIFSETIIFICVLCAFFLAIIMLFFFLLKNDCDNDNPKFNVISASISGLNSSSSQLTAQWDIGLLVVRPNKKNSISYWDLKGRIYYGDDFVSETSIAPFTKEEGEKNQTTMKVKFAALESYVPTASMARFLEERSHGSVNFTVQLLGWYQLPKDRCWMIWVVCKNFTVGFSNNSSSVTGTLFGGQKKCGVSTGLFDDWEY